MSHNRHELDRPGDDTPRAIVAHQIPGRCRLTVPSMKGNARYFASVCAKLRAIPALRKVRTSQITASIVVEYTGRFEQISWIGRRHGLFRIEALPTLRPGAAQPVPGHWARRGPYTGSPIENLRNAATATRLQRPWLALSLGCLGAYQLWRADPIVTALNLLFVLLSSALRPSDLQPALGSRGLQTAWASP